MRKNKAGLADRADEPGKDTVGWEGLVAGKGGAYDALTL